MSVLQQRRSFMRTTLLAFVFTAVAAASPAVAGPASPIYRIDPTRSVVQFTVTKLGFADVPGTFRESAGEIRWDASQPEASSIRWRVRVASVQTDAANRDSTLQAREYFDAVNHPELMYENTGVRALDAHTLEVTGRLTMRGVTRQQIVRVRHNGRAAAPVFETDFEVDRYDFGIVGGRVMSRVIGRTVRVHLRLVTLEHTS
jgi:polyisoprenoid-binding protein YceI